MTARMSVRSLSALCVCLALASSLASGRSEAAPDNTMKEAMRKMQAAVQASDMKALSPLYDLTKRKGAPEFETWGAISDRGKSAAERSDVAAIKATCTECHYLYRAGYKAKYGSRAP
jgi:hypothetical protein